MFHPVCGKQLSLCFGGNPLRFKDSQYPDLFARFGFHNASAIDSLLDKDDVSLEAILDEDDLLQECKSQNTRLIDYFQRVDVLKRLLGYVTGQIEGQEERGRFKCVTTSYSCFFHVLMLPFGRYPYVATEVLCSEIWSIVETCVNNAEELLSPFWETVLDRSPEDMKTEMVMASHFAKIDSVFLTKKPAEVRRLYCSCADKHLTPYSDARLHPIPTKHRRAFTSPCRNAFDSRLIGSYHPIGRAAWRCWGSRSMFH